MAGHNDCPTSIATKRTIKRLFTAAGADLDLFSRQVVGWSLREDMTSVVVIDALRMAWFKRHPGKHAGVLFHRDCGSQSRLQGCA